MHNPYVADSRPRHHRGIIIVGVLHWATPAIILIDQTIPKCKTRPRAQPVVGRVMHWGSSVGRMALRNVPKA
jgi:hypothetical protein